MPSNRTYRVFLSAAEPSGDAHCAGLIRAIKAAMPGIEYAGVGGPKMAAAGCRLLDQPVDRAAMGHQAFKEVAYFYGLLRRVRRHLRTSGADLVIVCDSPSFNFHVAKAAKQAGIATLFYVAPQLWAWGEWRIRKFRQRCDKLCCILPFEEPWFRERGIDADFVGNPLLDALGPDLSSNVKGYQDLGRRPLRLALMPGSRTAEIRTLWQPMQEIALRVRNRHPDMEVAAVAATEQRMGQLRQAELKGLRCLYSVDSVYRTAQTADLALVASGSATLEVAAGGCPMVVMYQTSRVLWHLLGRWIVRPKYFTLVNLIADRPLVREFVPCFASIEPVTTHVLDLLASPESLARLSSDLVEITLPLAANKAAEGAGSTVLAMLGLPTGPQ